MRVLVLGSIDSKWVKDYIEYVLLPLGHQVEVIGNAGNCKFQEFYRSHGVLIHQAQSAGRFTRRIPFVRILSSATRTAKQNQWNEYDVIVNMFVNHKDLRITQKLKSKQTKTVVYYTGSDLLRKSKFHILLNRLLLRHPDAYVMGSETLEKSFCQRYPEGMPFTTIHFGISSFENIRAYRKSHPQQKDGPVFCIGYNGSPAHHHLAVLELFERLTEEQKKSVELVLPMTYGASSDYLLQVRSKLDQIGIRYRLLTEFLDNDGMAGLWCSIHYFINAQTTDSLSASVLEAQYAGAVLLNAQWLDYPEYRTYGIRCASFSNYEELYQLILDIVNGKQYDETFSATEKLERVLSWNTAREAWQTLFLRWSE